MFQALTALILAAAPALSGAEAPAGLNLENQAAVAPSAAAAAPVYRYEDYYWCDYYGCRWCTRTWYDRCGRVVNQRSFRI